MDYCDQGLYTLIYLRIRFKKRKVRTPKKLTADTFFPLSSRYFILLGNFYSLCISFEVFYEGKKISWMIFIASPRILQHQRKHIVNYFTRTKIVLFYCFQFTIKILTLGLNDKYSRALIPVILLLYWNVHDTITYTSSNHFVRSKDTISNETLVSQLLALNF